MDKQVKEILCITQEECSEVSQSISKVFRFGWDSCHPKTGVNNKEHLEEELGDLLAMVDILVEKCIISDSKLNEARAAKRDKLKAWSRIDLK
jgi:NTP pyrophosphatase (non-canonical NTP hydrolase)